MKITNYILLDFNKTKKVDTQTVQCDMNSRFVRVSLHHNNSPIDLSDVRVCIMAVKPDGKEIFNDCTVIDAQNGLAEFEITKQMGILTGTVECQIKLFGKEKLLSSNIFNLSVSRSLSPNSRDSKDQLNTLVESLNRVDEWDDQFQQKYNGLEEEYAHDITEIKGVMAITPTVHDFIDETIIIENDIVDRVNGVEQEIVKTNAQLLQFSKEMTNVRNVDLSSRFKCGGMSVVITGDSTSYNRYDFDNIARGNAYDCYPGMLSWSFMLRDAIYRNDDYFKSYEELNITASDGYIVKTNSGTDYAFAFNGIYARLSQQANSNSTFTFEYEISPITSKLVFYFMRNPNQTSCSFDIYVNNTKMSTFDNQSGDSAKWQGFETLIHEVDCSSLGLKKGDTVKVDFKNITQSTEEKRIYFYGIGSVKNDINLTGKGGEKTKWLLDNIDDRVLKYNPDLVIISMAANDIYYNVSVDEFEKNYRSIIEKIKSQNNECEIVILTSPLMETFSESNQKRYNDVQLKLACEFDCYYVDLIEVFRNTPIAEWRFDNVHFSKGGNTFLANYMLNLIMTNGTYDKKLVDSYKYFNNLNYSKEKKEPKLFGDVLLSYDGDKFKLSSFFNSNAIDHIVDVTRTSYSTFKIVFDEDLYGLMGNCPTVRIFGTSPIDASIKNMMNKNGSYYIEYALYKNGTLFAEGDWDTATCKFYVSF